MRPPSVDYEEWFVAEVKEALKVVSEWERKCADIMDPRPRGR
jgi:hypothetical protein